MTNTETIFATVQSGGFAAKLKNEQRQNGWMFLTSGEFSTLLVMQTKEMLLAYADSVGISKDEIEIFEVLVRLADKPLQ